jgi:hypothetical protein
MDAGRSLDDAAAVLECSRSKISRIELGSLGIRSRDVRDLLDDYGVTDAVLRDHLMTLAKDGAKRGWWQQYSDIIVDGYASFIGLEADAEFIRTFETVLVPGLLQIEPYSLAVIRSGIFTMRDEDVDAMVRIKMERQRILGHVLRPVRLWAVICEAALRTPIGGPDVMRAQLEHLTKVVERPNITVQVLPFAVGAHAGLSGPFSVFAFGGPLDSGGVFLENLTNSIYLDRQDEVAGYSALFDNLRSVALNPADSLDLITEIADEFMSDRTTGR